MKDDEDTRISSELGILIGRVRKNEQLVKCLHGPNVSVRLTDAAVRLERRMAPVGKKLRSWIDNLQHLISSVSERSTGWRAKGKRRGGSSRGEQDRTGSGRGECHEPNIGIAFAEYLGASTLVVRERKVVE